MLVTKRTDLRGQFLAPDHLRLLWDSASLNADSYYFIVEGSGFVDGCLGPSNHTLIVGDVRFLAATGWTDFTSTGDYRVAMSLCWEWMSDFTQIRIGEGFRKLRPVDLIARNICARDFLATELAKDFGGKTVVVTHHCPIEAVAGDAHEGHLGAAYFNQWGDLVSQADAWIFGHTHYAVDTIVSGCRLISNPRGYPGEKTGFVPDFIIEI